jgi:preprotein translocase subunit SecF
MTKNAVVRIDFLKYRVACLIFSLSLIGAFFATYIYRVTTRGYAFTYSVDFTGGTQVLFKFEKPVRSSEIVAILERHGWASPITREFSKQELLVRVKEHAADVKGVAENMRQALQEELGDNQISILENETVGSGVGAVLRWKSFRAVAISLLLMLFYIAARFWSFAYAIGAVLALLHDALVMLAVFLFFDREISINVIGAILAVLGYSINDTIVIFSRIRENVAKMRSVPMYDIINISINQTLSRTLLTSFSTTLTVLAMFFLGGEALRDFSLALLVGIFFGTYSSIYMASPIMLLFYKEDR